MDFAGALGFGDAELVSFVGAGGKKTAMGRLVEEAGERGLRVGYTTTTHAPPPDGLPLVVADATDLPDVLARAEPPVAFASERVADPRRAAEKVRGFAAETVGDLYERDLFDWLLVKADGARRREFKAPAPDEPVIPTPSTHVVPVASVAAVGEPVAEPVVHRPRRVAALTEATVGEELTPELVGTVFASSEGGCKNAPPDATVTPLVNKADTAADRSLARDAIETAIARSQRITRGLVTSFETGHLEVVET